MLFLFSLHGTKGDILPFLQIAKTLQEAGHEIQFVVNEYFFDLLQKHQIPALSSGEKDRYLDFHADQRVWDIKTDALAIGFDKLIGPTIVQSFRIACDLAENSSEICVIGNEPNFNGAIWAAELLNLKRVSVFLWPRCINSSESPPAPLNWYIPNWFSRSAKIGFANTVYSRGKNYTRRKNYFLALNRLRKERGLAPFPDLGHEAIFSRDGLKIGLFPSWFGLPAPDWPANFNLLGFPELPETKDNQIEIFERFVLQHGAPVLFTSGTGVSDTQAIFAEGLEACARLRLPALLIGGSAKGIQRPASIPVLHLDYLDFGYAFPKCRAVVHHGGIGTFAEALRARVPQLMRPLSFDQPDNADRAQLLGIAARIPPKKFKAKRVASELSKLIESHSTRESIEFYADLMSQRDTTKEAVDLINSYVSQPDTDFGLPIQRAVRYLHSDVLSTRGYEIPTNYAPNKKMHGDYAALLAFLSFARPDLELQEVPPRSSSALSLAKIIEICRACNVPVRALRVNSEAITQVVAPCLIQWQHTRFVVFLGFEGSGVRIFDPVLKQQTYTLHEFSWHFSGYAVEIEKAFLERRPEPIHGGDDVPH